MEAGEYRDGISKFNEHDFTSTVEYIAIRRAEIQAEYERRLKEYGIGYEQKRACL